MLKILLILCLLFLARFAYSIIYNFHSKKVIRQFFNFIKNYQATVLYSVKLKHTAFNGAKWLFYNDKICDIYMMNDYWVLLCRSKFIFEIERFPIVIAKDSSFFKKNFPDFSTFKLTKVNMKHSASNGFEIHYMDERYKHYKGDMTFKDLTPEQIEHMKSIVEWLG